MVKNTTAFKLRFEAYKNGKSISEIYDAGLPKYDTGKVPDVSFSDDEAMDYILRLENPNRIGFTNGIWRPPTDARKYDVHQIGGGLDMREEHNPIVYNFLKSKGRLNNPYLTELEEKDLRLQTWNQKKYLMNKFVLQYGDSISLLGYDTVAAMLWHGHPFKVMNIPTTITGKALAQAIENGDRDLSSVFNAYYGYGTNATRFASRVNADSNYRKSYKPSLPVDVNKSLLVLQLETLPEFKYWQNYHQPDYSFDNPAPESISSWNNPTGPAYTGSALQAHRANNNIGKIILDAALSGNDVGDVLMDNLSKTVFGGKKIGFKDGKLPKYGDGKRYIWDEQTLSWDRITDDEMSRAFADLTVTPKGNRQDIRTNPIYHDKRLKNAGYVTREMLEDEANSRKQRETAGYAPGLEQVSPEFDLLLFGSGLRFNPLTLLLWKNRKLAKEIDKVVDEGIIGATKEMPLVRPQDLYDPEHFRSTVNRNAKLLGYSNNVEQYTKPRSINPPKRLNSVEPQNIVEEVPESVYEGPTPKTSVDRKNLYRYKDKILEIPHLDRGLSLPENEISKYVDSEGNVNMRNVVSAVRQFYKDNPNARNYKDIINSSGNLYQHIKDVVKSAQQAPIPKGYTRLDLVQAALFHDIGKTIDSSPSHALASTDILDKMGINVSPDVRHAIRRHMGHHLGDEDALTRALHFVDVVRNTLPMSNYGAFDKYRNLLYPSNTPYKIKQQYSWDTDYLLDQIINPILREYGYDEIPLGLSKEEARKQVLDRVQLHRRFVRGLHDFNEKNLENARLQFIRREGREPTREELFDQGFEYLKEHNTSSGDRGMDEYLDKFELPRKKYMSLYTSNSDEVPNSYIRGTNDDFAIRAIEMPVLDNPDWSLAELWGYNDYPLVYSSGGHTPTWNSNWRYDTLPTMLNNDINTGAVTKQTADHINASNIKLALQRAIDNAKQIVAEGIKNKDPEYSDFPQYKDIEPSVFLLASAGTRLVSSEAPFPPLGDKPRKMLFAQPNIGNFIGLSTRGYDREFGYNSTGILDYINEINNFITKYGGKEIIPPMYSKLPDTANGLPTTVIKYPRALHDLHKRINNLKSEEEIPAHIPIKKDAYGNQYIPSNYRRMSVKQAIAHNNANKIRFTKDGYPINTPIVVYDQDYTIPEFAATNTKYVPSMQKLVKDAVNQYFKDIKMAKSKDAFVRRKLLEERQEWYINNKINLIKDALYLKPELIVPTSMSEDVDYPFMTESFDGYRVFVTEHDEGPGSKHQNNYIIVGPRGSKQLRINRDFKFDVDNHGHTRGRDNIGKPAKGLTKNAK